MHFLDSIPDGDRSSQLKAILDYLSVPNYLKGYDYLSSAILLTAESDGVIQSGLYDNIAKMHNTTKTSVERAIQVAIRAAWDKCDLDILNSCFGYTVDSNRARPTPKEFISILADYLSLKAENDPLKIKVTESLHTLGVPASILGYHYLRTAIILTVNDPDMILNITKRMYKEIASKHTTTISCVDRSIRKAIEISLDRGNVDALFSYFGYHFYNAPKRPTDSEYIAMISDDIRLGESIKSSAV